MATGCADSVAVRVDQKRTAEKYSNLPKAAWFHVADADDARTREGLILVLVSVRKGEQPKII